MESTKRQDLAAKAYSLLTQRRPCSTEKTRFNEQEASKICALVSDSALERFIGDFEGYYENDGSFFRFNYLLFVRDKYGMEKVPPIFDRVYNETKDLEGEELDKFFGKVSSELESN